MIPLTLRRVQCVSERDLPVATEISPRTQDFLRPSEPDRAVSARHATRSGPNPAVSKHFTTGSERFVARPSWIELYPRYTRPVRIESGCVRTFHNRVRTFRRPSEPERVVTAPHASRWHEIDRRPVDRRARHDCFAPYPRYTEQRGEFRAAVASNRSRSRVSRAVTARHESRLHRFSVGPDFSAPDGIKPQSRRFSRWLVRNFLAPASRFSARRDDRRPAA